MNLLACSSADITDDMEERLSLQADLLQIARIPSWIERLSARYPIPEKVQYASDLCLEEVIANIILHGYRGDTSGGILVCFATPRDGCFVFIVEDEAPHFNPLEHPELPALDSLDDMRVGGQGLRLIRAFANALEYEELPVGNRLKMFFSPEAIPSEPR